MALREFNRKMENAILVERGKFVIKIAESDDEILEAKRLRYKVFKAEQGRLDSVMNQEVDEDVYDDQFTHLLVVNTDLNIVVGTYRMQSGVTAQKYLGFYSESEYDIKGLDLIANDTWEMGRSCVDPEYRSGAVIALLWAGISAMHQREQFKYLIGCVSLEAIESEVGWALYEYFKATNDIVDMPFGYAKNSYVLPKGDKERVAEYVADFEKLKPFYPPLLKGYLRLGAQVAGEPVLDRQFGSIDFLVLFDFKRMDSRYARHFQKN